MIGHEIELGHGALVFLGRDENGDYCLGLKAPAREDEIAANTADPGRVRIEINGGHVIITMRISTPFIRALRLLIEREEAAAEALAATAIAVVQ